MMLKSEADKLKSKRFLLLVLPVTILLSACQSVFAIDSEPNVAVTVSNDVENYHQIVTVKNETNLNDELKTTYSATEAVLFPDQAIAYGSRIFKGTDMASFKTSMFSSPDAAYEKTNQEDWQAATTTGPLFSNLEVYPYASFIDMSDVFIEKGELTSLDNHYAINYFGSDPEVNRAISEILNKFPVANTVYEASISIDKETQLMTSFSLIIKTDRQTQEIKSHFSKHNQQTPKIFQ